MNKKVTSIFETRWGFILACVGSAVGMANIWGFPYKFGSNGNGTFLIPYLFFVILFSYVGLSTEYAMGRFAGTGTLGAYEAAFKTRNENTKIGKVIGWIPLLGSLCIALGYAVIVSYVLKGLTDSVTGTLMHTKPDKWFESFSMNDFSVIPFHILIIIATLLTTLLGVKSIEKTNKVMMPLFFILFVFLAIRMAFIPNISSSYITMFSVDFKLLLDPMIWVWAMGQAFFSLSITGSGMLVYGAYLSKKENVVSGAKSTAFFDTLAAIVAVLVIIPACFAYNVDVNGGPGLLFVTLPNILQNMYGGQVIAIVLFLCVCFAGVTSLQNMFEVVLESLMYKFPKLSRILAITILGITVLAVGIFIEPIFKWGPWMDLVSIYVIPIGASLGSITWFWVMDKRVLLEQINLGSTKEYGGTWYVIGKFIYTPISILLCAIALINGISF